MKKNITNKTYCLVQENNHLKYRYRLLTRILNINAVEENCNCVILCNNDTKKLIKNFPVMFKIKLIFIKNNFKKYGLVYTYVNIMRALKFCVENYGNGIYLYDELYILRKFTINDTIKNQGFVFHKKIYKSHIEESNKSRFSFELIYASNLDFISKIEDLLNFKQFINNTAFTNKEIVELNKNIKNIEYNYYEKYEVDNFFDKETLISTEDFLGFEDNLSLTDISDNFTIKDKNIYFLNLRLNKVNKTAENINNKLLQKLNNYNRLFFNLIMMTNYQQKVSFIMPPQNVFGLWNRENENHGLYELIEFCSNQYSQYCSKKYFNYDYFSINTVCLFDKNCDIYLSRELTVYKKVYLTNYSASILKKLDAHNISYEFMFYCFENPLKLDEYFHDNYNKILTNVRDIDLVSISKYDKDNFKIDCSLYDLNSCIEKLVNVKYATLEKFDVSLMVLCFACGCIPIFNSIDVKPFDIELDKHYHIIKKNELLSYEKKQKYVVNYYKNKISLNKSSKKLFNSLFIWHV